ncbi:DUF4038 domain-containing protein [bacterium]|nr:MAG: DUF4038 domain-containing protein [bacterium]
MERSTRRRTLRSHGGSRRSGASRARGLLMASMEPQAIQYQTWERAFLPTIAAADPFRESLLRVEITNPYGDVRWREGFWDGGVWRLRWMPLEEGPHHLRIETTLPGLPASLGVLVEAAASPEPGFRHGLSTSGPVRVADDPTRFARHDGAPFFLACEEMYSTPTRATDAEWAFYCAQRSRIGFTGVGLATDVVRSFGARRVAEGEPPAFAPDLAYLARLDRRIATLNAHGLIAIPELFGLATIDHPLNVRPGSDLDDVISPLDAVRLGRYLDARWGASDVLWRMNLPGGADEDAALVELTAEIGRSVFGVDPWCAPVTVDLGERELLHPLLQSEAWIGWIASRTHGRWNDASLRWIHTEHAAAAKTGLPRPHVNVDPVVYGELWNAGDEEGARSARELVYASVFAAPPAGAGFAMREVHDWVRRRLDSGDETRGTRPTVSWLQAIEDQAAEEIGRIVTVLSKYRWADLSPAPELLLEPSETGIAVLASSDRSMIRVYVPRGGTFGLTEGVGSYSAYWISPRMGEADVALGEIPLDHPFTSPDERDWVLELDKAESTF